MHPINHPDLWLSMLPIPGADTHKYARGHGFCLGGEFMTGATCLAARAAQRIGAGIVAIACPASAGDVYRIVNQSAVIYGFRDTAHFKELVEEERINAFLVGPGLGDGAASTERILHMIRRNKNIVLDADALTKMAQKREPFLELLHARPDRDDVLLTPHAGEFAQLFPECVHLAPAEATIKAAKISQACVLRKGANSYIASPHGQVWHHPIDCPWLATAGSGDVLSGLCLGLMAQGINATQAGLMAMYVHAQAGLRIGTGLVAEDLNHRIAEIYTELCTARQIASAIV